ncbi:MAG: type II toxin-antitoxin system Phd/YefM family antitoxin [Chloroflexi bacterium]|nr:type II toxin-antitoxin system Phd/YefM family antitoxin [Chloroflexota bacterium]
MRYVPVEEARKQLGRLVKEAVDGATITIGRRGTEQAVLLSADEYERLRRMEEEAARSRFRNALQAIGAEVKQARLARSVVDEAVRATRRTRRP